MRLRLIALLACACVCAGAHATTRDGSWWNRLPRGEQLAYAAGFLDGNTYAAFAVSGAIRRTAVDPRTRPIAEEVMHMNIEAIQSEVDQVDAAQLSDAVSRIYGDAANREIRILEVLYAAVRSVRGATPEETARFLQSRRPQAGSR